MGFCVREVSCKMNEIWFVIFGYSVKDDFFVFIKLSIRKVRWRRGCIVENLRV